MTPTERIQRAQADTIASLELAADLRQQLIAQQARQIALLETRIGQYEEMVALLKETSRANEQIAASHKENSGAWEAAYRLIAQQFDETLACLEKAVKL